MKYSRQQLGDRVATFAQPIARIIDKLSGGKTNVVRCGGCAKMKKRLDEGMPIGTAIKKRLKGE